MLSNRPYVQWIAKQRDKSRTSSYPISVDRILDALKSGNIEDMHGLEDICPPAIQPISATTQFQGSSKPAKMKPEQGHALTGKDGPPLPKLNGKRGKNMTSQTGPTVLEDDDLRKVVKEGLAADPPVNQYQSLLDAGYIQPATEFLN